MNLDAVTIEACAKVADEHADFFRSLGSDASATAARHIAKDIRALLMNDIAERLRGFPSRDTINQAADEIERLRAEVKEWEQAAGVEAGLRREFKAEADRLRFLFLQPPNEESLDVDAIELETAVRVLRDHDMLEEADTLKRRAETVP